jgi:hypothetical protein
MLVSLLPGLRDLRTPLAVGYLWLLCLWLWWGDTLLTLKQQSNTESGPIHSIFELSGALGAGVVLSAVSFVAYLLGTMLLLVFRWNVLSARRSAFHLDRLTFIVAWFEFVPLRIHSQPIDRLKQQVQEAVRARQPDLGSASITTLVTTVCDQLDAVGIRLQAFDKEMWDTFDRSKAESQFRSGLVAPLTLVSIIATAKLGVLWLLLLIVPFWFTALWAQKAIDATATLVQAVTLKIVNPPVFDRTDELRSESEDGDNSTSC